MSNLWAAILLPEERPCLASPLLDGGSTTPQVRVWVALLAGQLPFAPAAITWQMWTQVPRRCGRRFRFPLPAWSGCSQPSPPVCCAALSPARVERLSVTIGTPLRASEQQQAPPPQANLLPEPTPKRPKRLYVGRDGVFVPLREAYKHGVFVPLREAYKHTKSLGDLTGRYGEGKSGVVYEACQDTAGKESRVRPHAYVATLDKGDAFGPWLGSLAHQHGHHRAKEGVGSGDGAPWIWHRAAKPFTGAVQSVDCFQASQQLAHVAAARCGKDTQEGHDGLHARPEELTSEQRSQVLAALQAWKPTSVVKQQLRQRT